MDFLSTISSMLSHIRLYHPPVAGYSLFDSIYARLGVVRVYLIRNCCSRYGLSRHELVYLFITIC